MFPFNQKLEISQLILSVASLSKILTSQNTLKITKISKSFKELIQLSKKSLINSQYIQKQLFNKTKSFINPFLVKNKNSLQAGSVSIAVHGAIGALIYFNRNNEASLSSQNPNDVSTQKSHSQTLAEKKYKLQTSLGALWEIKVNYYSDLFDFISLHDLPMANIPQLNKSEIISYLQNELQKEVSLNQNTRHTMAGTEGVS